MFNETNPENKASTLRKLNPEFYTRLYPSGWDLSEHCAPQEASNAANSRSEEEQGAEDDTLSAP
jgi:hypothetical protein